MTKKKVEAPKVKQFSAEDLKTYENFRLKLERDQLLKEVLEHRIDNEKRNAAARLGVFLGQLHEAKRDADVSKSALAAYEAELEKRYDVRMDSISYDDITGTIHERTD